jgi:hypothetical protein
MSDADGKVVEISKSKAADQGVPFPEKPLRILVAAQLGGVGKSTITGALLHPYLGGSIYSIESRNQDAARYGLDVQRYNGTQLRSLQIQLHEDPHHAIIDLGASSFDAFMKKLMSDNIVGLIDYVVGVAAPSDRGQNEGISSYESLMRVGFKPEQYRLILNRADEDEKLEVQFKHLFAYKKANPQFNLNPNCVIPVLSVFDEMAAQGVSWETALSLGVDFSSEARRHRANGEMEKAREASERGLLQGWALGATRFMKSAFNQLKLPV